MIRGFKYRFYPTPDQAVALERTFGCARYVYNWALRLRTDAWFCEQRRINYAATDRGLTLLKHQPGTAWLSEVSSVPLQQSLRHLQAAFVNFWEKRSRYPVFRSKRDRQSATYTRSAFSWDGKEVTIAKVGRLKIRWSRRFSGKPSTVTVSRAPSGKYYVSFCVDEPLPVMAHTHASIGVDLGLHSFAALSTGESIKAPRPMRRKMAQLKRAQKALSRKRKGSANRAKARRRVAQIHERIAETRKDFLHKLSTKLVRENQTIVVEDLNVRGMRANRKLAGAISDSGWAEFVRQLGYKCAWYGRALVKIDRFYPSSKRCSACGYIMGALSLDVRTWNCPECGACHDRDLNAARNILGAGLALCACGDGVRPKRSKERKGGCPRSRNRLERRASHGVRESAAL